MNELHQALQEELPRIYREDGSIDFEVIDACMTVFLGRSAPSTVRTSPLEDISLSTWSVEVDLDDPTPADFVDVDPSTGAIVVSDPIAFALHMYLARKLLGEDANGVTFESELGEVSPELANDPYFTPDLPIEAGRYLSDLAQSERIRYAGLGEMHETLTPATNNVEDLACIVAIPVAGHQEHGNILRTLEQFTKQDLPASKFEVVLYLNLPGGNGDRDGELAQNVQKTLDEITLFKQRRPDIAVRFVTNTYRLEQPSIGRIRSDLWDLIGLDMQKRGRQKDILVISADADIIHLNRQYLSGMVHTWQESGADIVTANLLWQSAPGLPYDSTVNRLLRYQTLLDNLRDNYAKVPHTSDANTGISLAMYFAVGGYHRKRKLGEMRNLVSRILYYRQADKEAETFVPVKRVIAKSKVSNLKTHNRRLIKAMALGRAPYEAWDQRYIAFGNDDTLRTAEAESALAEEHAQRSWRKWIRRDTPPYIQEVPLATKRRVLKAARRLLDFSDLYR